MSDTVLEWVIATVTAAVNVDDGHPVVVFDSDATSFAAAGEALPDRYVVLYGSSGLRSAEDLAHRSDEYHFEWQLTSCGRTRQEAMWLGEHARDALVDQRPDVDGLSCSVVEQVGSQPARLDDQVATRALVYVTDQYALDATAAAAA